MKKQLIMKAFRAILALVMFVGAVTLSSAQTMPSTADAARMLNSKIEQLGSTSSVQMNQTVASANNPIDRYRAKFYKGIVEKVKGGLAINPAIDAVYEVFYARNQAAANTLRQEVIDYLTKS